MSSAAEDEIQTLKCDLVKEVEAGGKMKRKNERLTNKLALNQSYTEELREQVAKLSKELDRMKMSKSRNKDGVTQTEEDDRKKAENMWNYGYTMVDGGEQDQEETKGAANYLFLFICFPNYDVESLIF
jgi:hypothetical protein